MTTESPYTPSLTQAIALGLVGTADPTCERCGAPAFVWCDGQMFCRAWWQLGACQHTCPFCHHAPQLRACAELRGVLFDPEDDGPAPEDCPPIPDATPDTEGPSPL